eukprot:3468685-Prymnesium_polylepis.1
MDSCTAVDRGRAAIESAESRHGRTAACKVHPQPRRHHKVRTAVPRNVGLASGVAVGGFGSGRCESKLETHNSKRKTKRKCM